MVESKESLKKRIDTNKNQQIENNEVDDFLKNGSSEELNNLWEHLNNLPLYSNDELKKALNNFFRSPERNKYDQTIKNKVANNQPLDKTELSLMYLAMISDSNTHLTSKEQLKFDSDKPVDQICEWALIMFIRTKYNFPTYTWKNADLNLPNEHKKNSENPLNKENKWWNIELPDNIWEIKEDEADFYCDRLITRAEQNFPNEISKAKREIESKHRYKNDNEKQAYIKYDTLLIAFEKYTEIVWKKHDAIIHQSWYENKEDFENQLKLIDLFEKNIQEKYHWIDKVLSKIKQFWDEIKANEKKYFKNENERKKAEQNSKEFNEYIDKKTKELDIDKAKKSINKDPETPEEAEEYCNNLNKIFIFQEEISEKSKSYWDSITKYQKYIKWAINIQNKYNIQQYQNILDKYNQDISNWNKKINFKKYENYTSLLQNDRKLTDGLKNINTLNNLIVNSKSKSILVKEFKQVERQQQIKQEETDEFRDNLKKFNWSVYWTLTTLTWLWNWLIDATVWTLTSFMVFEAWLFHWKEDAFLIMDVKEKTDNYLKKDQSSTQKKDIYNSETKEFNFHADNTVSTVASSISQMLVLIYWWWGLAKWATKAFWMWEKIAWRVWLFSSSFIMQVWWSYQEAINSGLRWWEALWYSMLSATVQSWLELISPNEVLLWKWNWIVKELIKNTCKRWSKESLKMIWKTFTKNVWLEIAEENIQETLQLAAWNLINMSANWTFWSELWADWSWKNFASTAIITTLTTWITTWTSTWLQMNNLSSQDKAKLIEHIKNDKWTNAEVTEMIDKAIAWKVKIPNVNIQQLQDLKLLLSTNETTWNNNYFDWKSHKIFKWDTTKAESNSKTSDRILNEINEQNKSEKLNELRKEISKQYKQATWEDLQLTDEQLLSILDAHEQDWILWELTTWQLKQKVKILSEAITDPKVRRFLLEAGFCWSRIKTIFSKQTEIPQYTWNYYEKQQHFYQINEWVRIPRSIWSSTRAKITSYNQWIYTVEWSENGQIKAKELTQQEIDQENQLKMNPEEITRFNKYLPPVYRNWWLFPSHKINIWNWTTLYTTDKIVGNNSWRQYIIWYTFDNYWTMHLRQFYRSMSEWCRRACPGMREDWNLSKWEFITDSSYETTTKVDLSLWNTFDSLKQTYYNDFWPYNNYFSYSPISYIASSYNKNYILSEDMWPQNIYIRKLFPNLVWNDKTWHNKYNATDFYAWKYWHTIESVTKWYNNLVPEWLDYKHMKLNPRILMKCKRSSLYN